MIGEFPYKEIKTFELKDLHKKIVQLVFIPANPECLEPYEQFWAYDVQEHKMYLLHERNVLEKPKFAPTDERRGE